MRAERTTQEVLSDKAFTLALLAKCSAHNGDVGHSAVFGDRLKLQKLCFLTEYPLFRGRAKGLNYTFFTYRWGPFTKDLYEVEMDFEQARLMTTSREGFKLTEHGMQIGLEIFESLASDPQNRVFRKAIEHTVTAHCHKTTDDLIRETHEMPVLPIGWSKPKVLDDLPYNLDLTRIIEEDEALQSIEIDEAQLDRLGIVLRSGAKRSSRSAKRWRL